MPDLPTISERVYHAARRAANAEGWTNYQALRAALDAVWPDLHALAVASLPAAPAVLSDVTDEDVEAARLSYMSTETTRFILDAYRTRLAARMPVWQPIEPGTVIKAGTLHRVEWDPDGEVGVSAIERTNTYDIIVDRTGPARYSIDTSTVPADPDADLIRTIEDIDQSLHGAPDGTWGRGFLDALATAGLCIEPKPAGGPLGGAR